MLSGLIGVSLGVLGQAVQGNIVSRYVGMVPREDHAPRTDSITEMRQLGTRSVV